MQTDLENNIILEQPISKEVIYSDDDSEEEREEKREKAERDLEEIKLEIKKTEYADPTSEITLECLMNKSTYLKYIKNQKMENNIKSNIKNRKFYKKRIYDLTKQLMHSEPSPSTEISKAFENYINSCINYFQILDKTDILQEDYATITDTHLINTELLSIDDANKSMMRFVKMYEPNSLEKIVKRTVTKLATTPIQILPKQKNINLKDPILRNKGICKKNNISNKYEDTTV